MTPRSNHAALALLRADPDDAMAKYGFIVSSDVYTVGANGGQCLLFCESVGPNIYKLTAKLGAGDFFFPYINGAAGVGDCVVPQGQENGVIATTGGMNGCSLQVNKFGSNFTFYHDNNGSSIAKLAPPPAGDIVARVDYSDYVGPMDLGSKLAQDAFSATNTKTKTVMTSGQYQYYCLTIRHGGKWKVYYSSILEEGTTTINRRFLFGSMISSSSSKSVSYRAFYPTFTPLITSFEDA